MVMKYKIIVTSQSKKDIEQASKWYEQQKKKTE